MAVALRFAARSDLGLGPKARNEDSGYAGPNLLVLADGMGGHAAGDVASSMIVGELAPLDEEDVTADQAIGLLEDALRRANAKLTSAMRENDDLVGMGSTTIVMLRTGTKIAMAHIGDSRAFLLRGDTFSQITRDHSFVQQLVDEGRIAPEDATSHPQRSVVTRVMTGQPDDQPDTSLREAKVGDRFLLCSDGLSDFVGSDVIEEILREAPSPDAAADRCIAVALRASTRDNVTVIVADVVSADSDDLPDTSPQVVGAASGRVGKNTRAIPTTPAAKAAALSREATGAGNGDDDGGDEVELAESGPRSPRAKAVRRGLGTVVVAAILGGGGYAAWAWSQQQYFVAASDGHVAIFRGVSQDLGPIGLSRLDWQSDVLVSDLPSDMQGSIGNSITARDLADAQTKVERLRTEAARCQSLASVGTPCGTSTGPLTGSSTGPSTGPLTGSSTGPSTTPTGSATTIPGLSTPVSPTSPTTSTTSPTSTSPTTSTTSLPVSPTTLPVATPTTPGGTRVTGPSGIPPSSVSVQVTTP